MTDATEPRTPVADFLTANRTRFATALFVFGALLFVLALYAIIARTGLVGEAVKDESALPSGTSSRVDWAVAGIQLGVAGIALILTGVWLKNRTSDSKTDARKALLYAGGELGISLMVIGLWLSYAWFQPLVDWLDKGDRKEAKWPILAGAIFLAGGAIAFFSSLPARAEDRTDPQVRRHVYAFNLVLSAILLFVALAAVNVFVSLRVPNALDTTEGGFYTFELSGATKEYLAKLDRPVTAYVTIPRGADDHIARETYRLLDACAAANPEKFKVRPLSSSDREEIQRLTGKFPQSGLLDERGILLVAGADESEYAFVRETDLAESKTARGSRDVFQGEAKLARELLFLAEGKVKAVVYFTSGSGELSIVPGERGERTALRLKAILEKNNVEVKPLSAGLKETTVPADAAVVVVADPLGPLPTSLVDGLTRYMTTPRPNGKMGKLILLAGPHPVDRKGVAPTGLEDLLANFGVRLLPGYLFSISSQRNQASVTEVAQAAVNGKLLSDRNPIARAYADFLVPFPKSRPLQDLSRPDAKVQATPLFVTLPRRPTWLEPDPTPDPIKSLAAMEKNEGMQKDRDLSDKSRVIGMVVTEGDVGRAVVLGCGELFDDKLARQLESMPAELFANAVDWLRDRPAVANIANKSYGTFTPKPDGGTFRGEILPVGLVLFAVLGLGAGVWVTRRK